MNPDARVSGVRVGLTGGIGCGKSTVADVLRRHGVPVLDTDTVAHEAINPRGEAYASVVDAFGHGILAYGGMIDREKLGARVFADEAERKRLNGLVHPVVRKVWTAWCEERRQRGEDAVVVIPLLYEVGAEREAWDAVVCVTASPDRVLCRLRKRGWSDEKSRQRIAAQWPVSEKSRRADFVIENDGTLDELEEMVLATWKQIGKEENLYHG